MSYEATPLRGGVMRSIEQGVTGAPVTTPAQIEKHFNIGRFDLVVADCRRLLAEAPRQDKAERKSLSFLLGNALIKLHRIAEADAFRIEAILSGDISEDSYENSLLVLPNKYFEGEYRSIIEETTRWLNSSKDLARVVQAQFAFLRGKAYGRLGNISEAGVDLEFAYNIFSEEKVWISVFLATNNLGFLASNRGQPQVALGWYEKGMELLEVLDIKEWIATNLINLGIVYYKMGRLKEAETCLSRVFTLDRLMVIRRVLATIALGNVFRMQGKSEDARQTLRGALKLSQEQGFCREEALSLEFLGDVERDDHRPKEARKLYAKGLKVAMVLAPRGDLVMELQRREGECLDLLGRHRDAEVMLQRSLKLAQGLGDQFEQGVILRCLGFNAASRRDFEQAEAYCARSLNLLVKAQANYEEMILRLKMAQMHDLRIAENTMPPDGHVSHLDQAWGHALAAQGLAGSMSEGPYHAEIDRLVIELTKMRLQRRLAGDSGKEAVGEGS